MIWPFNPAFSVPFCMWTSWFESDQAYDHSVLLSHVQFVCELVDLTLTMHLMILSYFLMSSLYVNLLIWLWPCIWPFCLAFSFPVLLSHVQLVCQLVDLTVTMHLTILSCFLISSLYVNLLIWLWPCSWPFCLTFSCPGSMWTCWFHSGHASDHSVLLSHFQEVCELADFKSDHASDHSLLLSHF